jgi:hypothetical protein
MGSIAELNFLGGDLRNAEQFNELYEGMLNECRETGDKETARAMQQVLFHQAAYLINAWLREEAKIKKCEERGEVQ